MTPQLTRIVLECGGAMCLTAGGYLLLLLRTWPRIFLRRYPAEVRKVVPPLSQRERSIGLAVSIPFLLSLLAFPAWASFRIAQASAAGYGEMFLAAYLTWTLFNLFDWLVLDELVIGVGRPSWLVLKGAEHVPLTFDHAEHAIAFLKGAVGGAVLSALIAGIPYLL
jgi:hypothetical protein